MIFSIFVENLFETSLMTDFAKKARHKGGWHGQKN